MNARTQIIDDLKKITDQDVELRISENSSNGDYYTNVAMKMASVEKKKPLDIAYEIKLQLFYLTQL